MQHALVWILASMPVVWMSGRAWAHPQDGPDIDLRVQIEDDGVLMATAINLAFLDAYGLAPRENVEMLDETEAPAVREMLVDFLRERVTIEIDGVAVSPVEREWEVPPADRSLLPLFPLNGMAAIARVRLVLSYPAKTSPESVMIRWEAYPADPVRSTPADPRTLVIAGQMWANGVSWVHELTAEAPSYTWQASDASGAGRMEAVPPVERGQAVTVPALSIGLMASWLAAVAGVALLGRGRHRMVVALSLGPVFLVGAAVTTDVGRVRIGRGAPALTDGQARAIFEPLHTNIYRAFDYTEEEDVYDALAQSAGGSLLETLYEQISAGLVMQLEDGAAVSRVQRVEPMETDVLSIDVDEAGHPRFKVAARWRVTGAVFHWGHSHTRTNEHKALYTVIGTEGGWRIVESQMLEQWRVDSTPGGVIGPGMDL